MVLEAGFRERPSSVTEISSLRQSRPRGDLTKGGGDMVKQDLVLDPAIRNWGVLPIVVFVLCINLVRTYLQVSPILIS